jgi:hypothetical protein
MIWLIACGDDGGGSESVGGSMSGGETNASETSDGGGSTIGEGSMSGEATMSADGSSQGSDSASGGTFACGAELECPIDTQYCETHVGPGDAETRYGCVDLPPSCGHPATCDCLVDVQCGNCEELPGGGLQTACLKP